VFYYDIRESLEAPVHVELGAPVAGFGNATASSRTTKFGIYIQDDWEVTEHLTLNLGGHWDYDGTPGYTASVTPAEVLDGLRASIAALPGSSVDVEAYISTGRHRSADKDSWAPRLGFSYDFFGDQRHVLFGGAGRCYG